MSISTKAEYILRNPLRLRSWRRRRLLVDKGEPPLRSEIFGLAQLERHAALLASSHDLEAKPGPERLLRRLAENEQAIRQAYETITKAVTARRQIAPAAEWLLDNYYLTEEQIDVTRELLPSAYSRELPRLRSGRLKGYPRVYDLSMELVAHTDGRVDYENVEHFVAAYQSARPLKLGELWAVPIMLRLALIENLRRVAHRIAWRRRHRDLGAEWGQRFAAAAKGAPQEFIMELADFVADEPPLSAPFVSELASVLEGAHPSLALATNWIEQQLAERGQSIQLIQQAESQEQAADQLSIGNSITSLRTLNAVDWRDFVEEMSVTEKALRRDPSGFYAKMDFRTRDRYRHAVEGLARRSGKSEPEVADIVVELAALRRQRPHLPSRQSHIGYFLIGRGREELERKVGFRPEMLLRARRFLAKRPLLIYLAASVLLTLLMAVPLLADCWPPWQYRWGWIALLTLATIVAVSRPAISLVNWFVTLTVPPRSLPRLDLERGIPEEYATAVVVPTLLHSQAAAEALLQRLEIKYLANKSENLLFGLLTDFPDAAEETLPQDAPLIDAAIAGIRALNEAYGANGRKVFFLLHRPRLWNAAEGVWMGYERKRGKLEQFNKLVTEGDAKPFTIIEGDLEALRKTRYVITLDTDTQLPPGSAWKLIGTMAHPLNRPQMNPTTRCVEDGYGVLQPILATSLLSAGRSLYAKTLAGEVGIDPYTREVSNVYQDLFWQGQFSGKGIYDLAAFATSAGGRFPENRILSHDLIEGNFARCSVVDDVELTEDHPSTYLGDVQRRHRWTRGDWQIARWLWRTVPDRREVPVPNPLPLLARWLILDNLRRTLVPFCLLLAFLLGWFLLPGMAAHWTAMLLVIFFLPSIGRAMRRTVSRGKHVPLLTHFARVLSSEYKAWAWDFMDLVFLPFQAFINLDAVARVFWRLLFSRRRLLEWQTSFVVEHHSGHTGGDILRDMWIASFVAAGFVGMAVLHSSMSLAGSWPILVLWFASPALAYAVSLPTKEAVTELTPGESKLLGALAKRTWMYFEHFVVAEQNWLPADNFQEEPAERIAGRTSPTNIGLALASNLAAYDLGYLSVARLVDRTTKSFDAMGRLERYRGHFYNWYGTRTLQALHPRYVSTVDSGNLTTFLLTLKEGLRELQKGPVIPPRWRDGLTDAGIVALEEIHQLRAGVTPSEAQELQAIAEVINRQVEALRPIEESPRAILLALEECDAALSSVESRAAAFNRVAFALASMHRQCEDLKSELLHLLPWAADGRLSFALARPSSPPAESPAGVELSDLRRVMTLDELATLDARWTPHLEELVGAGRLDEAAAGALREHAVSASERASARIIELQDLATQCEEFAQNDVEFLYDSTRKLLSLGYNVEAHRRDSGEYDLLASEARLCSYTAIALGALPTEHWFHLGRQLAPGAGAPVLVSWGGSLFEYLMPLLVMPTYPGTLLRETCAGALKRQIAYGRLCRVPWGFSESCYNQVDANNTYQYRAFGVPSLGLKRGLADDLVVAPYASVLALTINPRAAIENLRRMAALGFVGQFGAYEAVDYTRGRLQSDRDFAIVRCYMAHHSGMSLLALSQALVGGHMWRRFMAEPRFRAMELLLQERVPMARSHVATSAEMMPVAREEAGTAPRAFTRTFRTAATVTPEVQLLSNGRYHVMISNSGGGYSSWQNVFLTRWREDSTRDNWGMFFYVQDVDSGDVWSTTYQPLCRPFDDYEVVYSQSMAEFRSVRGQIEIKTEVAVSPEDDVEVRRMTLTNLSGRARTLDLTSYAETVLMDTLTEAGHPAFHGLFLQSRIMAGKAAIIYRRRPKASEENWPALFHTMVVRGVPVDQDVSFETDRARFIRRGHTVRTAAAARKPGPLSNSSGFAVDPIMSIRRRIHLPPRESVVVDAVLGVGAQPHDAELLVDKYHDHRLAERVFDLAWTHSQVLMHQIRSTAADAQLFGTVAGLLLYAGPHYRAPSSYALRNRKNQSDLWSYGISGDLPIVLVRVTDKAGLSLVQTLLRAHAYWRHKGLGVELVIWAEGHTGYRQDLLDAIAGLAHGVGESKSLDQPGGIFIRNLDLIPEDHRALFLAVARAVFTDSGGTFAEQVARRVSRESRVPQLRPAREATPPTPAELATPQRDLVYFNGIGGFTPDGREYVIIMTGDATAPAPWANVLANPSFGSVVTESGGAYTWYENAHEFRLTPWYNDATCDTSGELFYIRDEETGRFWSPARNPARGPTPYIARHGLGYTAFEHAQDGIFSEVMTYVSVNSPVKFSAFRIRNDSDRTRKLSITGYCELVLGERRQHHAMHVVTRIDPQTGAIVAWNAYNYDFPGRLVFFNCSQQGRSVTGDRMEFLGRNGSLASPVALKRCERLSDRVGAGLDPCAAIQTYVEIPPGEEQQVVFVLGAARNEQEAHRLLSSLSGVDGARSELEAVWQHWKHLLGGVYVETPDLSVNFLANHWLLYQVLSARFWGRTGYYQSSGAYGFRDQLQDSLAFLYECPWLTRQHLLLAASRQFREGDVQHWWHPPRGRGKRTRISDDLLWLPYITGRYIKVTKDTGILDERVSFLEGRPLADGEESYYDLPQSSESTATLYQHCVLAIERALRFGAHKLPLMGAGDWNDGMNRVGHGGKGESVWLAFFLHAVLESFAELAALHDDASFASTCKSKAQALRESIAASAWDGDWYLRAFFDDGTALGSAQSPECQIDSLSQSWSVLSGAGEPQRAAKAMQSVMDRLVDRKLGLIKLLDPPFDSAPWNTGYIKGYVPGVRENGGQYTHAAVWATMAFARMRQSDTAWELFRLLNPIRHADNVDRVAAYKVEPYALSADIYTAQGVEGRGGWTWYTGSAGWTYQLLLESLLGLRLEGDTLSLAPLFPPDWSQFAIHYRYRETFYHIEVVKLGPETWKAKKLLVDGVAQPDLKVHMVDDRKDHAVRAEVG